MVYDHDFCMIEMHILYMYVLTFVTVTKIVVKEASLS